jgi:iron-sulfur cluster repair protein YtfE (RIC family)
MYDKNFGLKSYLRMHNAIRRDLEHIENRTARLNNPGSDGLLKLQQWFDFYWDMVESHHKGEDRGAFPMLAKLDPEFASRVPVLTFDHHEIDTVVDEIQAAFSRVKEGQPGEEARTQYRLLVGLIKLLRQKLDEHLTREEAAFIPAIARNFTLSQQAAIEERMYRSMPDTYLEMMVPWTLQYVDAEEKRSALGELSARFRYLYSVSWQKRFDRLAFFNS